MSIVVPSLNSVDTIGRTLGSLVQQEYLDLEILVVDGGSDDGTVEVIRQFEPELAWWVSEPDRGQAHAINKGFARATGQFMNWLCSDDWLLPGALHTVAKHLAASPLVDVLVGACRVEFVDDPPRSRVWAPVSERISLMPCCNPIPQASAFYRRALLDRPGPLDESFHVAMDTELFNDFKSRNARFKCVGDVLAVYVISKTNKTSVGGVEVTEELERIYRRYVTDERVPLIFWHRRLRYPLERVIRRHRGGLRCCVARRLLRVIDVLLGLIYDRNRVAVLTWKRWG